MLEINPLDCITVQEKLLYNIYMLLKNSSKPIEEVKQISNTNIQLDKKEVVKLLKCNKCTKEFENKGQLMAHYRKEHPKEGK